MMRKLFFILFILLILTTIKSNAQYFQNLSVGTVVKRIKLYNELIANAI